MLLGSVRPIRNQSDTDLSVSVRDSKTVWPHPTSSSTLFLLFQAASNRLIAPLTLHKDPLIQPSSLLSSRPYLFSCLVAAVIISGGWFVSGVLRMLTAAVRKAEKGGKWERLQRGTFWRIWQGGGGGQGGNLWMFILNEWRWKNNLTVSSQRNDYFPSTCCWKVFFFFLRLLQKKKSPDFTFPLFQGWEGKWDCGDRVCFSH